MLDIIYLILGAITFIGIPLFLIIVFLISAFKGW